VGMVGTRPTGGVEGGRFALIIASSEFEDATLRRLTAPPQDAEGLRQVLADPTIGGFEVTTYMNAPSSALSEAIEVFFDGRRRDDLLLLYYSGHGIKDMEGRLHFAARNTRNDRLRSTAIPASFIHDVMLNSRSRSQVLVLDCCHSGAFTRGMVAKAGDRVGIGERFQGRGRVILAASDAMQYAFEGTEVSGGAVSSMFTRSLVGGLRTGAADLNHDGYVSLDELYDFVHEDVVRLTPQQRPAMWAFDVHGDLWIARSPEVVPAPADRPEFEPAKPAPPPEAPPPEAAPPDAAPPKVPTALDRLRSTRMAVAVAVVLVLVVGLGLTRMVWDRRGSASPAGAATAGGGGQDGGGQGGGAGAPFRVKVNFQSPEAPVPPGYLVDFGQPYGPRKNAGQGQGLTYGWVLPGTHDPVSLISQGRDRNRPGVDQRLDTFMHMEGWNPSTKRSEPGSWEIAVPNGAYVVTVSVQVEGRDGKASNTVNVEGKNAIDDFKGTPEDDWESNTVEVAVEDGRLTLDSFGGHNTKINYVEITGLATGP
jgi:Caspase domain